MFGQFVRDVGDQIDVVTADRVDPLTLVQHILRLQTSAHFIAGVFLQFGIQSGHSQVLVKFPDFSNYFLQRR